MILSTFRLVTVWVTLVLLLSTTCFAQDQCSSFTSCDTCTANFCGWCPSNGNCMDGDIYGPTNTSACPSDLSSGQWTYSPSDCKCLTATSCDDIEYTQCGWCPATGKAYIGNHLGPSFGLECVNDPDKGQWTRKLEDCKCLTAQSCGDILDTNCGWCPSRNRSYIGDVSGPAYGMTCPDSEEKGQWTWNSKDCICLNANSCTDIIGTECGWCPSLSRAFIGTTDGPNGNIPCAATQAVGQWTWYNTNCKCLTATGYLDLSGTDCGWCPSYSHAYLGDTNGPSSNLTCPTTAQGQWTFTSNSYNCQAATQCPDISLSQSCGWCLTLNRSFVGDDNGPTGFDCLNGWIWDSADCFKDVPVAVSDLTASSILANSIQLIWTAPNSRGFPITSYTIFYQFLNRNGVQIQNSVNIQSATQSYLLDGLISETKYNVTIVSRNKLGYSFSSNIVTTTTPYAEVFSKSTQGTWNGTINHYLRCDTEAVPSNVGLTVGYRSIKLTSEDGIDQLYDYCAPSTSDNFYTCYRPDDTRTCVYLDETFGAFRAQLGSSSFCPFSPNNIYCSGSQNVGSARIVKQGSTSAKLSSTKQKGEFMYYSGYCSRESDRAAIMQVSSNSIQITRLNGNLTITDIKKLSLSNMYSGKIGTNTVCLYYASSALKVQLSSDGICPTDQSYAECSSNSRIETFSKEGSGPKPGPKASGAGYIAAATVIVLIVFCCCSVGCCVGIYCVFLKKPSPNSRPPVKPTSQVTNSNTSNQTVPLLPNTNAVSKFDDSSRCKACYIHQKHHSLLYTDQCDSYSQAILFVRAESFVSSTELKFVTEQLSPTSNSYKHFEDWLRISWTKQTDFTINQLKYIVKFKHPTLFRKYENYLKTVGRDKELLQWHGTSRENMLNIATTGFLKSKVGTNISNFARFGNGIYFSLCSSKSHEYSVGFSKAGSLGVVRNWEPNTSGLLLCRVVTGRVKTYEQDCTTLTEPPRGYESVEGLVGPRLNYPELVVYNQEAILPVCYIEYTYNKHF